MTFLPIVGRELRVAARRPASYWSRTVSASVAILFGGWVYIQMFGQQSATIGISLFYAISVFAMIYCLTAGIRSTSDCISSEKREGTLGLLFLTDLKGYDIVFGKLAATSLRGLYGLMAILPVLAIPFLMGGVTNAELGRIALTLGNIFFFSLSLGLFMSCVFTKGSVSKFATFFVLVIYPIILYLAQIASTTLQRDPGWQFVLGMINPWTVGFLVMETKFGVDHSAIIWASPLFMHAMTWVLLLSSCRLAPRSWQDKPGGKRFLAFSPRQGGSGTSRETPRGLFRRKLLDRNPFFWLVARERHRLSHVWIVLGILFGLWGWGWAENGHEWFEFPQFFFSVLLIHTIFKIMVTYEAGRRLSEDRKIGSLELLLSTPLGTAEIIRGQFLALRRNFLAPMMVVLAFDSLCFFGCLRNAGQAFSRSDSDFLAILTFGVTFLFFLALDCLSLSLCSMWASISQTNSSPAAGSVFIKVVSLPVIALLLTLTAYQVYREFHNSGSGDPGWFLPWALYTGFGLAADIGFGIKAWHSLKTRFREVATHRFTRKTSLLGRIFGGSKGGAAQPAD